MDAYCVHDVYDANVIEFKEACYARCNCWTDLPSLGGQIILLKIILHQDICN